jgi:hypothetical protein
MPVSDISPGLAAINLTQMAPLLALVGGINASVVASWAPVIERTPPKTFTRLAPTLNAITPEVLEGVLAGLEFLNLTSVAALLPVLDVVPPETLALYVKLASAVSGGRAGAVCATAGRARTLCVRARMTCMQPTACAGAAPPLIAPLHLCAHLPPPKKRPKHPQNTPLTRPRRCRQSWWMRSCL